MTKKRVFLSFDYDHDADLTTLLLGQAKHPDSPFEIYDFSIKEHITGDWKAKARQRIKAVDVVCVICGEYTHTASGVSAELTIAQEEGKNYFLLSGRANTNCKKPITAKNSDKMYSWNWDNLKSLIGGGR